MDEKMKTTLLTVFCILIIVGSFITMQYARSISSQQTIELVDISFKAPRGYSYLNDSYESGASESNNGTTFHRILLQNQDNQIIELTQYENVLQLSDDALFDLNDIPVHKNVAESLDPYEFNFSGKGYTIRTPQGYDNQLVEEIVSSMKVKQ